MWVWIRNKKLYIPIYTSSRTRTFIEKVFLINTCLTNRIHVVLGFLISKILIQLKILI
jgi:hypothetical protein